MLSYAGQAKKALEIVEQALRQNPQPPGWYFFTLGQAYYLLDLMRNNLCSCLQPTFTTTNAKIV